MPDTTHSPKGSPASDLFAKLFPGGVPEWIKDRLQKDGGMETYYWLRCRGVGPQAVEKLRQAGVVLTPVSDGMEGLSVRLMNVLYNLGADTIQKAEKLVRSGELTPGSRRNYGKKCHEELCRALGIDTKVDARCRCDKCGQLLPRALANVKDQAP